MKVVIPFKFFNPKSRLSSILSEKDREILAILMLKDVIDVLKRCNCDVTVIAPLHIDVDAKIRLDQRTLDDVVNEELKDVPKAVVMSDLPLLNEDVVNRFLETDGDVVIAPGRRCGTNMLLVRKKGFRVSYHYGSFLKHLRIARELGMDVKVFDSFLASIDIDDESDLLELMIHGKGKRSEEFLRSLGFKVEFEKVPKLVR